MKICRADLSGGPWALELQEGQLSRQELADLLTKVASFRIGDSMTALSRGITRARLFGLCHGSGGGEVL